MQFCVEMDQLEKFLAIFKTVLDRHALIKKRYIRTNQAPFMKKTLEKAVMTPRLRNKFLENKALSNESTKISQ